MMMTSLSSILSTHHRQLILFVLFFCIIIIPSNASLFIVNEESSILRGREITTLDDTTSNNNSIESQQQYYYYDVDDEDDLPLPPIDDYMNHDDIPSSATFGNMLVGTGSDDSYDDNRQNDFPAIEQQKPTTTTTATTTTAGFSLLRFAVRAVNQTFDLISQTVETAIAPFSPKESTTTTTQSPERPNPTIDPTPPQSNDVKEIPDDVVETNRRCQPACPKRTLLVAYRYPKDMAIDGDATLNGLASSGARPSSSTTTTTSTSSSSSSVPRPVQGLGMFVIKLLKDASQMNILKFRGVLSNAQTTNTPTTIEESLNGLGMSPSVLDAENELPPPLQDDLLNDASTMHEIERLQRGFVVLRLLSSVGIMEDDSDGGQANFVPRSLAEIEETTWIGQGNTTSTTTTAPSTTETFAEPIQLPRTTGQADSTATTTTLPTTTLIATTTETFTDPTQAQRTTSTTRTTTTSTTTTRTTTTSTTRNRTTITSTTSTTDDMDEDLSTHYQPPFHTTYLSNLHMESIEAPTEAHVALFKKLLMEDPNVAGVYDDDVLDFDETEEQDRNGLIMKDDNDMKDDMKMNSNSLIRGFQQQQEEQSASGIESPNDKFFDRQWGLTDPSINRGGGNVINAWPLWNGSNQQGTTTTIALIDSGVDLSHRDIDSIWRNEDEICDDGIDNDKNGYIDDCYGWDFIDGDNVPQDGAGHGTASAGIIAAIPDNTLGITPICWQNCRIMNLRVLNDNIKGPVSGFVKAIDYALQKKVRISNNSYGAKGTAFGPLEEAVKRAQQAEMVFIAAAGNFASDNEVSSNRILPASWDFDNIISVAAVDKNGGLASFSNWGRTTVDIGAPGDDVLAPTIGGGYQFVSGTSFAVPHITGLVALIWSQSPKLTYKQVIQRVLDGSRPLASLKDKTVTGGTMDALRSLSISTTTSTKSNNGNNSIQCADGFTVGKNNQCVDINECALSVSPCPSLARCINFEGTFDCRCPSGSAWNALEGAQAACLRIELPSIGICRANGGCGVNSLCQAQQTLLGRARSTCKCNPGFVKHPDAAFCIRIGLESMDPDEYLYAIDG